MKLGAAAVCGTPSRTLKYGTNGETYKLPLTLEPYASAMIDLGEMIRTQQLDQSGKILPADVTEGSVVVSSPANDPADAIAVVLSGGIYNPTRRRAVRRARSARVSRASNANRPA